jgi:competence protein ComEC
MTGDIGKYAEWERYKTGLIPRSTVLKAGHHGSNTSSSVEFFKCLPAANSMISIGKDNDTTSR